MATYTDINYHLVFATKNRVPALTRERRDDLYRFIWGVLKNRGCHLYRIPNASHPAFTWTCAVLPSVDEVVHSRQSAGRGLR
ncbi:MAG: transposase [Verrucomicrobiales bacterium]